MLSLTFNIDSSGLDLSLSSDDIAKISKSHANNVRRLFMDNFGALGGRKFWGEAAESTTATADANVATLTVSKVGVRLRWRGGMVLPGKGVSSVTGKPTELLALPQSSDDSMPGDVLAPLVFVGAKRGKQRGVLVEGERRTVKRGKRKGSVQLLAKPGGMVYFRLVTDTSHTADPHVLPSDEAMRTAVKGGAEQYFRLKKILNRKPQS